MMEFLGVLLFVLAGISWAVLAGGRNGTVVQSSAALLLQASLSFGSVVFLGLREDEVTYFGLAQQTADALKADPFSASAQITPGKESFVWVLAILILLFGPTPLPGLMMNALFVSALPALLVWAGRNFGLLNSGRLTGWLAVFAPPIVLWGPGLKREAIVFFLLGVLLVSLSLLYRGRWSAGIVMTLLTLAGILTTRASLVAVCGFGVGAVLLVRFFQEKSMARSEGSIIDKKASTIIIASCLTLIPAVLLGIQRALESPPLSGLGGGISELSDPSQATAVVGASWGFNVSPAGLSFNALRSLVGPMPWEVTNFSLFVFWLEGIAYGVFFSTILIAFLWGKRLRGPIFILFCAAIPLVGASTLLLANYGLNSRIRVHIFLLFLPVLEPFVLLMIEKIRSGFANKFVDLVDFRQDCRPKIHFNAPLCGSRRVAKILRNSEGSQAHRHFYRRRGIDEGQSLGVSIFSPRFFQPGETRETVRETRGALFAVWRGWSAGGGAERVVD